VLGRHIGVSETISDAVRMGGAGDASHGLCVAIHGLVLVRVRLARRHPKHDETPGDAVVELLQERPAPDEIRLLRIDETAKPSFDERVLRREVAPERRLALLDAQGLDGAAADQVEALGLTARQQRLEEMVLIRKRVMQLPAELAHIIHAQRQDVGR